MKKTLQNEPVLSAAAISAIAGAILATLIAFGVPVEPGQAEAILNLVAVITPPIFMLVGAAVARSKVSPVRKAAASDRVPTHRGEPRDESV